jgi:NAD(P)-dependent dehydrogenase (short-subunit alcohol dehydrogenase family)
MKIVVIGATGTIGRKVSAALEPDHEVIKVGYKSGEHQVDITSPFSIQVLFERIGKFDALVATAGGGHFGPLNKMTDNDFRKGIDFKLMGQINLVLIGQHYINPEGSFTLTSGILSEVPIFSGANLSAVNSAIEGFVLGSSVELENNVRVNAISPGVVEDSPDLFRFFSGHIPVSMNRVANAYLQSVFGPLTGKVIKVH